MIMEFTCLKETTCTGNCKFWLKLLVLLSFKKNYYKYWFLYRHWLCTVSTH